MEEFEGHINTPKTKFLTEKYAVLGRIVDESGISMLMACTRIIITAMRNREELDENAHLEMLSFIMEMVIDSTDCDQLIATIIANKAREVGATVSEVFHPALYLELAQILYDAGEGEIPTDDAVAAARKAITKQAWLDITGRITDN